MAGAYAGTETAERVAILGAVLPLVVPLLAVPIWVMYEAARRRDDRALSVALLLEALLLVDTFN
jgi:hypothetical protein